MELDTLLQRFASEYQAVHGISPGRRAEQLNLLRRLASSMGNKPLDQVRRQHVLEFMGQQLEAGISPQTVRNHLGMVRSFAVWLREADLASATRLAELQATRSPRGGSSRPMPNPYTVEELHEFRKALLKAFPAPPKKGHGSRQWRAFQRRRRNGESPLLHGPLRRHARRLQLEAQVALALEAGLRRIEIVDLSIPTLHYANEQLLVVTAKQGPGREIRRAIPYTAHARACVKQWLDFRYLLVPDHEHPWLQLGATDGSYSLEAQLQPETMRRMSAKLPYMLGSKWRWHRFRHTAATEWLRSGVPIEKVQRFMGHSSITMTMRYVEILQGDINDAFAAAEADFAQRLGLAA
jgi:site-specific recombinase XerD